MGKLRSSPTRRQVMKNGAAAAIGLSLPTFLASSPALAAAPLRKNIDSLSATELDNYKHALDIVIQRGKTNPADKTGYAWQAALHNDFERVRPDGSEGACEHRSELFFPWHRAHLAGFENILRASDPARTANVTIPYWDWTTPASGVRFPKAFEDTSSPLFHSGRYLTVTPETPRIQWDANEIKTKMVQETDWNLFAGAPFNANGTGGSFGWVEDGPHNTTHGDIGPTMGFPPTASRDPIYWSFHAYIDLIWARWQRVHTTATHPQPFTTPGAKIWVEPFTPVVGDMAQTTSLPPGFLYGYDYDFSIDGAPILVAGGASPVTQPLESVASGERMSTTSALSVQAPKRRILRVRDVTVLADHSYAIHAYVHPPAVNIEALSPNDRARYRADSATVWMSGGHAHHPTNVNFDLTKAIAAFGGGEFKISILTEARPVAQSASQLESVRATVNSTIAGSKPLWGSLVLEER